jgi:hypothetical protein
MQLLIVFFLSRIRGQLYNVSYIIFKPQNILKTTSIVNCIARIVNYRIVLLTAFHG